MKEKIRQVLSQRKKKTFVDKALIQAAVLIPIYQKAGECYLVFTKRTEEVNDHKGQISFPGGVYQAEDESLKDTALRESWEEIGLNPQDVEILGELDDEPTYVTNFVISPFVASIPYPYPFKVSPREVEEIIEVPLAALLDKSNLREEIELHEGKRVPAYFYEYNGKIIWGATARILKRFLELVFSNADL
jgi:8-oxo-dGTP pyrophosphatase MutT (NUDIX family)